MRIKNLAVFKISVCFTLLRICVNYGLEIARHLNQGLGSVKLQKFLSYFTVLTTFSEWDQTFPIFLYSYVDFFSIQNRFFSEISLHTFTILSVYRNSHWFFRILYMGRKPFSMSLYKRKLISIKEWRQSTAYKKIAKVWPPFLESYHHKRCL